MRSGKFYSFNRRALIRQFGFSTPLQLFFMSCVPGLVFLLGAQRFWQAWVAALAWCAMCGWSWRRQHLAESRDWEIKRKIVVYFEDGELVAKSGAEFFRQSLADLRSIEVYGTRWRGRERLVAVDESGTRRIYAGYDDMEAFVRDFRNQAPRAAYRERIGLVLC